MTPFNETLYLFTTTATTETIAFKSTTDNNLEGQYTVVLRGTVQFGTATTTTEAIFDVVLNPCAIANLPAGSTTPRVFDFEMNTTPQTLNFVHDYIFPDLEFTDDGIYKCVTF